MSKAQHLKGSGIAFLGAGQPVFLGIGLAFVGIGIAFLAKARKDG